MNPLLPDPMRPRPFTVRRTVRDTADTFTLTLAPADDRPPDPYAPGQFHMLYAFGTGEAAISLSGDPDRHDVRVHTIRAVGTVTRALQRLRRGDTVGVRGPFGTPWPVDDAQGDDVLIVAGGIGLAPLRPVVHHILARRARYGRVALVVGARTPADLLFKAELDAWSARADLDVRVCVDRAPAGWSGNVGVVTTQIDRVRFDPADTVALLCGPEIMMRVVAAELRRRAVAPDRIHVSLERNMRCAAVLCGHCQFGPRFVCHDGPVFPYPQVEALMGIPEI